MSRRTLIRTTSRRFVGQNIKGTPKMSGRKVRADLKVLRANSDAFALQEFKWDSYWRLLGLLMAAGVWRMWPGRKAGRHNPIRGAQALAWRRKLWRPGGQRHRLLMGGSTVSANRWLRAVLLVDRRTGLAAWHGTTHFVVGGDHKKAEWLRKQILQENLNRLRTFLQMLANTGQPIVFEIDANIHRDTEAYAQLWALVSHLGGTFHGERGVEYLFTIPGKTTKVVVQGSWAIPKHRLNTDHEGRGITYYLEGTR